MEFAWTSEHHDLRVAVRRLMTTRAPVDRARALAADGVRHDAELWATMAEQLGLQALDVPEEHGGVGGSLVDVAVVLEEMGAVLHGGPFLSTAVLAVEVLRELAPVADVAGELLGRIAEGGTTVAVALAEDGRAWSPDAVRTTATAPAPDGAVRLTGTKQLVLDGADADLLLVLARTGDGARWCLVDGTADGVTRERQDGLDLTRPSATVRLADAPGQVLGDVDGVEVADRVRTVASVLLAAEQVGAAAEVVRRTAEHATTRRQFGRPVGSFQGVKHRLADMAVRVEMARSAAYWAAFQERGSADLELGALVARSYCSDALLQTAKDCIQLHGGIGFTWEHDAHLFLRRARLDATLLGDTRDARERLLTHAHPDLQGAS
ncbi:acyl-CoA dehydrogenase family protein [Nocardioides dongxiaopingii]|uniref:acyl-CoA dehydrogenase family protein n=1 Tax=Nocardioides dongxiaopingii TaxID=2576036 RepID=UPI0010C766E7|nr:acyl-CoA dehydrogenase family protein [Nocardioides dongxiaopingii]